MQRMCSSIVGGVGLVGAAGAGIVHTVPSVPILAGQIPSPVVGVMVWAWVTVMSTQRRRS